MQTQSIHIERYHMSTTDSINLKFSDYSQQSTSSRRLFNLQFIDWSYPISYWLSRVFNRLFILHTIEFIEKLITNHDFIDISQLFINNRFAYTWHLSFPAYAKSSFKGQNTIAIESSDKRQTILVN